MGTVLILLACIQPCQKALKSKGVGPTGFWDVYSNGCHNECLQSQALASIGGSVPAWFLKESSHCGSPGRLARWVLHNLPAHTEKDLEITTREISHHMPLITCPLFTVFKPWTSNTQAVLKGVMFIEYVWPRFFLIGRLVSCWGTLWKQKKLKSFFF